MSSNLPSGVSISKAAAPAPPSSSPSPSQTGPSAGGDSHVQRRSGGSGSFGAGAATRSSNAATRNKQAVRTQHKQSRKYRLTDEDAIAESVAMKSTNSRRGQTSITHLMNFSLPPRPSAFHQRLPHNRYGRRNPTWGLGSGHHAVDKARYVHSNYRFIVDPRRDYRAQTVDADVYLDWSSILQILASPQSQAAACPICLGDPVAPRMAKCGHIFCLHCLIRFMHSMDEHEYFSEKRARWKKCPICWDAIYLSETRPVRWYIGQEGPPPRENEDIVLRLVMRPAGSTLALPRDSHPSNKDEDIPWHFAANVMDFARVMKGSEDYMLAQFDDEIDQLEQVEKYDELMFGEDTVWTSKAIGAVNEAKERIKGIGNPPGLPSKAEEPKPNRAPGSGAISPDAPEMYMQQQASRFGAGASALDTIQEPLSATSSSDIAPNSITTSDSQGHDGSSSAGMSTPATSALSTSIAEYRARHTASHAPSDYYFYHALLHYYLSPLDIRILKVAFGDFASFPSTILPRVERVSTGHVVDEDLRKRAKYLAHLPHGCEVAFLECDWTDTVPAETLARFKSEIERRRKRNSDKDSREEKERVRAEKEEDEKRWAAARRKAPTSPVRQFQADDFQPLSPTDAAGSVETTDEGAQSMSPPWPARKQNGSSFASLASPSTSPTASRTVWGTAAVVPTSPVLPAVPQELNTGVDDGWLQGWERDLLQEEELAVRVEAAALSENATPHPGAQPAKKKKNKKITLMSTTNTRRGA